MQVPDDASLDDTPRDGRTLRARRTRAGIVDACIALVEEGDLRPTAPRIAERAGVSVRSVFQHFDDLESLFAAVADRLVERVAVLLVPIDTGLTLDERVDRVVRPRSQLLEAITPIRRAANVHGPFSAEITQRLRDGQVYLRNEVASVFGAELDALTPARADEVLDQLDVALSWAVWDGLRSNRGHTRASASRVLAQLVRAVLAAA